MSFKIVDPSNGKFVREYTEMSDEEIHQILNHAHEAFLTWRRTSFAHRAGLMKKAAELLRSRRDELARLMALEMGKPVVQGRSEVDKSAWVCEYYSDFAEAYLSPEQILTEASASYVAYNPLGVVLAIMPWNFPLWQVFRFAAPGLMAGNGGVLKHASNVSGSALAIEQIFHEAGFPKAIFRTVLVSNPRVKAIIENPAIAAVTLTGSTPAGQKVASAAGAVLKKCVLELGGSDPYIVLEDADVDEAASMCASSRMINGGQSCIAAKRFIVQRSVLKRFEERFVAELSAYEVGDPLDESTKLGPMAREDLRDGLHDQVSRSVQAGARLLLGGYLPDRPGFYYPATVLTDVAKGMAVYDEETFGPVAAIIPVDSLDEAVAVANGGEFGLGAAIFSKNVDRAEAAARDLVEAGCCFVNTYVRSDPRLPFGGIKMSGYGRELSVLGIREFVNIKTVYVK